MVVVAAYLHVYRSICAIMYCMVVCICLVVLVFFAVGENRVGVGDI